MSDVNHPTGLPTRGLGYSIGMHIDRDFVIEELRKAGKDEHVEKAIQELPEKIDHNEHAATLEKFGLDPGKLAEKAAERGLGSL
jgi:hypothetical protein